MGASVCLTAGGVAVISVRIAYDNLVVDLDFDSEQYSPDLVDDMTTLRAMWEMPKAGAGQ